jgi:hypothetical protein
MLEVTPIPYTSFQPLAYDYNGELMWNQPIAKGGMPVGVDQVVLSNGPWPGIITLDSPVPSRTRFFNHEYSSGDNNLRELDPERIFKFIDTTDRLWGRIYSSRGGVARHTTLDSGDGMRWEGLPMFRLANGHPTNPHYNDRWNDAYTWMTSDTQAYAVAWLSAGAYGDSYPSYFNYLVPFTVKGSVELDRVSPLIQLGGNGTWLPGACFDLGGGAFFTQERINLATRAEDGYRDDRTYLRAWDYSGNLLGRVGPISEQNWISFQDGTTSYTNCIKSADGTIISAIDISRYDDGPAPDYLTKRTHTLRLKRHQWTGSTFVELASVDFLVQVANHQGYVIDLQEIDGKIFLDYTRSITPAYSTERAYDQREMAFLDYDFNVTDQYVFEGLNFYDLNDPWSTVAPGHFGMAGYTGWDANGNDLGFAYLIQHAEGDIDGRPLSERRRFVP